MSFYRREEEGSSRTTGTTYVWGATVRSGRGTRRVMLGEREEGCCLIRNLPLRPRVRDRVAWRLGVREAALTGCGVRRGGAVLNAMPTRITAPSATSRRPCAIASAASSNCPPSENESGVTLTTPMISKVTP